MARQPAPVAAERERMSWGEFCEKPRSMVSCEYVWRRTELWIDVPWSADPPVT